MYPNNFATNTFQGGSGYAKNIIFQNISMRNVTNPIIIDQNYCDQKEPCKEKVINEPKYVIMIMIMISRVCLIRWMLLGVGGASEQCGLHEHSRNECFRGCRKT